MTLRCCAATPANTQGDYMTQRDAMEHTLPANTR
jgi:hypothetical protein